MPTWTTFTRAEKLKPHVNETSTSCDCWKETKPRIIAPLQGSQGLSWGAVEELFYQMVQYLHKANEVTFKNLFVDGTKIEANANRYTFVWKKVVSKNATKKFVKIQSCLEEISQTYMTHLKVNPETVLDNLKVVMAWKLNM